MIGAILLVAASVAKIVRPHDTARALQRAGVAAGPMVVRSGAGVEAAIGVAALAAGGAAADFLVAVSYCAFAGFVAVALARHLPIRTCGCFGEPDSPPSLPHVLLDLLFAGCAAYSVVSRGHTALPDAVHQPWDGVPFLAEVAVGALLAYLAMVELPRLVGATGERR